MKQTKHSRNQRLKIYVRNIHHSCEHMHSNNDYATAQSLMASVTVSSLGTTQLHFLEPGVKVNGDYYRNTVLLNMLLLDIRSVFGDYYVFSKMGHHHIVHVTLSPRCRERRQSLSLQRCGHLFARILESGATTASGVCFKRGSAARGSMMSVERTLKVERTSAEGVEAAGPCTTSSRQRLRSGIVV